MSRIDAVFQKSGRKVLIAYLTVGYPDVQTTLKAVPLLARAGCDIVELGIPFSDPMADGATIQEASHIALHNGITPSRCLEVARELGREVNIPLVFMTYLNPVLSYGVKRFCQSCAVSGISGLIVPDLPPEESGPLDVAMRANGLDLIQMLAPNSTPERIQLVTGRARGFIYLVSMTGVTGARQTLPIALEDYIARVRAATDKPLCVGFGISTPQQATEVAKHADGVIIGSRIVQLMRDDPTLESLEKFIRQVRRAIDGIIDPE